MELINQWESAFYILTNISEVDFLGVVSIYILCLKVLFLYTFANMYGINITFSFSIADKLNPCLSSHNSWGEWNWESFHLLKNYLYFLVWEFSFLFSLSSSLPRDTPSSVLPYFSLPIHLLSSNCLPMFLFLCFSVSLMDSFLLIWQCSYLRKKQIIFGEGFAFSFVKQIFKLFQHFIFVFRFGVVGFTSPL